jgi:metal-dependent amidase/aminoacylase/carboxypeptidase family protein
MMKKRRYLRLGWLLPLATRTARIMAGTPTRWRGTLILLGQPAEESGGGAKAMLADGLLCFGRTR